MDKGITTDILAGVQATSPSTGFVASSEDSIKDIKVKLDQLLEYAEQKVSDSDLEIRKFDLKSDVTRQGLQHQKHEFYILLGFKVVIISMALFIIVGVVCAFRVFLFGNAQLPKFIADNPNVLLAMVVGSFLTIFGILTALLKGLGQKEKNETPLAVEEVAKAIMGR